MTVSGERSRRSAATLALTGAILLLGAAMARPAQAETKEFYISTVHLDGNTGLTASADHPAEPFPTEATPAGGGVILSKPNDAGNWRMRVFTFHPAQVLVHQGDDVKLTFVGVQGVAFKIKVDGIAEQIALKRGEVRSVTVKADKPGTIAYASADRLPSMRGEIVVLPK